MSEFLTFALSKNVILDQIGLFTSYLSAKRAVDAEEYAKVATLEPDHPLLIVIMQTVGAELAASLGDRVAAFEVDGDIMRYIIRNPGFGTATTTAGSTASAIEPDQKVVYSLLESYVMAATIVEWLRIAGYDFAEGPTSALKSAESMAKSKLALLTSALTPVDVAPRPHKSKASPRRIQPI